MVVYEDRDSSSPSVGLRRSVAALLVLGVGLALAALSARMLADFDLPTHMASGRVVVQTRALMLQDQLAARGTPVQWAESLTDVVFYLTIHWGGTLGLQILGAFAAVGASLLMFWHARRAGPSAVLVIALATAAMHSWLIVRPATLSLSLVALVLLLLDVHRRSPGARRGRHALAALLPIHAVWSNTHGFVVIGVALVVGYLAYRATCRMARGRLGAFAPATDGLHLRETVSACVLTIGASCLNQAGAKLLLAPVQASHDFGKVTEWATATIPFMLEQAPLAAAFAGLALVSLAFGRDPDSGQRRPSLYQIGLFVLAFVMARSAVRLIPLAIVLVTPIVAQRLSCWVPRSPMMLLGSAFSTCLVAPWMLLASPTSLGVGFEPRHFSEGLIAYVQRVRPVGQMYNFFPYGGWLSWRLYPDYRVLVDGRQAWVHGACFMKRYYASTDDPEVLRQLTDEMNLTWAVTRASEGELLTPSLGISRRWVMTYWDETSAVYVRRGGPNRPLAAQGYRLFRHTTAVGEVLKASLRRDASASSIQHDGRLAFKQAPNSARAVFLAACGALATNDEKSFRAACQALERIAPGHPSLALLGEAWRRGSRAGG